MARFSVTADDDFGFLNGFDLEPVATALLHVVTGQTLGYYTLERNLRDFFVQCFSVLDDVIGVADVLARLDDCFELSFPIEERAGLQVEAIEIKQIKDVVRQSSAG